MDAIGQPLTQSATQASGFKKVGYGTVAPERDEAILFAPNDQK